MSWKQLFVLVLIERSHKPIRLSEVVGAGIQANACRQFGEYLGVFRVGESKILTFALNPPKMILG